MPFVYILFDYRYRWSYIANMGQRSYPTETTEGKLKVKIVNRQSDSNKNFQSREKQTNKEKAEQMLRSD